MKIWRLHVLLLKITCDTLILKLPFPSPEVDRSELGGVTKSGGDIGGEVFSAFFCGVCCVATVKSSRFWASSIAVVSIDFRFFGFWTVGICTWAIFVGWNRPVTVGLVSWIWKFIPAREFRTLAVPETTVLLTPALTIIFGLFGETGFCRRIGFDPICRIEILLVVIFEFGWIFFGTKVTVGGFSRAFLIGGSQVFARAGLSVLSMGVFDELQKILVGFRF